jgi:hypothetical protein
MISAKTGSQTIMIVWWWWWWWFGSFAIIAVVNDLVVGDLFGVV